MTELFELSILVFGAFITFCMYTTLYGKSNVLYSFAEESYVGFATGLVVVMSALFIWRTGFLGLMAGDWILAIGIVLGLLVISRLSGEYAYISRLPIGISVGAQLALSMRTTIFSGFINHIKAMAFNLFPADGTLLLYRWTILLSVIPMLTFFIYTLEMKGPITTSAKIGEYALYISLGAVFAQTYMGRLGMFVGFMQSFTIPSWKIPYFLAMAILVLVIVVILDKSGLIERWVPE